MFCRLVVRFATAFTLSAVLCVAQRQQPTPAPSPSPGTRPSPTPSPGPNPNPNVPSPSDRTTIPQQQQQQVPEMQRPVFLQGKVMLEDGTPPPDSVVIELLCTGNPRPQAYTDSKGRFSFELGRNTEMIQDASYGSAGGFGGMGGMGGPGASANPQQRGGMAGTGPSAGGMTGERQLMGCELRANLPGYRSDSVNLSNHRMFDNPDVGTIILHRMGNVEGTTISATTLQAPKDARKAYEKGRDAFRKNKSAEAEKQLQKAVEVYPKFAAAWFQLGQVQERQNQLDAARKSYEQALAADSKFVSPYLQLALLSARDQKWQDVADASGRALRLDPVDFPQAYFFNAVANYNLHKIDEAEKSAREAVKLDAQHRNPRASQVLGLILAQKHDYTGAAEQMRDYLKFAPTAKDADQVRSQLTELEKLSSSAGKQ